MADPNVPSGAESKKDTVRINLAPGVQPAGVRRDAGSGADQAKKETAMMGMPSEPKKDTSRVAVPAAKSAMPDMPRPTVRLRREPIPTPVGTSATPATAARAQVPEMPRPTVKLKVEETAPTAGPTMAAPTTVPSVTPAPSTALDVVLSLLATVAAAGVLAYLVFTVYK